MNQLAQSLKLNIYVLDFFHSFPCRVEKYRNQNIEVLWNKIKDACYTYDARALTVVVVVQEIAKPKLYSSTDVVINL